MISTAAIFLAVINGVGGLITFGMDHPKDQYYEKIPEVKENRLADVTNALGPIISDVHEFMSDDDDSSVEELTETDKASVAVADSLSPSGDLPPLKTAVSRYYDAQDKYTRCKLSHDGCYVAFVGGFITAAIPIAIGTDAVPSDGLGSVKAVLLWLALLLVIGGVTSFLSYIYYRRRLDTMIEDADFALNN